MFLILSSLQQKTAYYYCATTEREREREREIEREKEKGWGGVGDYV